MTKQDAGGTAIYSSDSAGAVKFSITQSELQLGAKAKIFLGNGVKHATPCTTQRATQHPMQRPMQRAA